MKKLISITLCIILSLTVINMSFLKADSNTVKSAPLYENRTYVIGVYDGKVACYEKGSEYPFIITEVYIKYLPERDRTLLQNGIEISGAKALSRVLEDYKG